MRPLSFSLILLCGNWALAAGDIWQAGFAKVDVTPTEPVRMAGYGNRDRASGGVDTPLYVRAMALKHGDEQPNALVSVDTIGLSGSMVRELTQKLEEQNGLARQRIVIACTHTHTGPDLVSQLSNIFTVELTDAEVAAGKRYRQRLEEAILTAVEKALRSLVPARLAFGTGEVGFAANRRVLNDGRWVGFGVQPDGPVDHSIAVLRVSDADGKVLGVIFNYACHCTTLDGDYYRINADWAGYAAADLEAAFPGSVALCTIGCGADANPEPRGTRELSELHGRALSREVKRVVAENMEVIKQPIVARFGYAGLSFDLPTIEELQRRGEGSTAQVRRHAEHFQKVFEHEGRLPATYPVPIQSWQFGDELTMVFLGGEVVVDYALRLKRELPSKRLWVTAYANDVLGYIASERMRAEGGYEYDQSAIYYMLPGPWAAGTEDRLVRRVHDLLAGSVPQSPLEPDEALRSIVVPAGFSVQLVASEPLVADPINLAYGHDGSLWVVEMGDYPLGAESASEGGRVKRLRDTNGDGVFDEATVFLEGLHFPTAVHPWRDGVIVIAAPDIFLARDQNGDGRADQREVLYTGLATGNPQHLTNGFGYGLDHSLHCAAGESLGTVTSVRTGVTVNASGRDLQIWPDSGRLAAISGRTQYVRSRNDWGDWFGSDNSRPMYHYPIEDRYLKRNPAARFSDNKQQLFDPAVAPPVFPLAEMDRFNDLFAANRFTSACSAIVVRSRCFGEGLAGAALVCEPVHNLVHRSELREQGTTYRAARLASEGDSEFLRSTDPWFRPVRVVTGPDGMIWVVDMYRAVIEHPEWIPQAWQEQIDLRAGHDRGRIYRVVPTDGVRPVLPPNIARESNEELVALLSNDSGTLRDMAQQEILERGEKSMAGALHSMASSASAAQARVHALWILHGLGELTDSDLLVALSDEHPGVVRNAILLAEPRIAENETLLQTVAALADHPDPKVKLQLALTLGESAAPVAGTALGKLAADAADDRWMSAAIVSSSRTHSLVILKQLLLQLRSGKPTAAARSRQVATIAELMRTAVSAGADPYPLVSSAIDSADTASPWLFALAAAYAGTMAGESRPAGASGAAVAAVYQRAKSLAADESAPAALRCQALQLFGCSLGTAESEQMLLNRLLVPATPLEVQLAAVERLAAFRDRASTQQLLSRWPGLSHSVRDAVARAMLSSTASISALVGKLESGAIDPGDLSPSVRQSLRQGNSQSLQARVNRVLGRASAANQALLEPYLQFQEQNNGNADVVRGKKLFEKHCAACHRADANGRAAGPDLMSLSDRSPGTLTESILLPNRSVETKYQSYVVVTLAGQVLSGAIAEEAGDTLTLSISDGKQATIQRSEIEELRNSRMSLMPEGFERELDHGMLRDLIEYLRSDSFAKPSGGR